MSTLIRSQRLDTAPGTHIYRMLFAHTDADGVVWPAGTEYSPLCFGHDGLRNCDYQTIRVRGRTVRFEAQ